MSNYLFLDIDGVLNAVAVLTHSPLSSRPWEDYQLVDKNRPWGETYSPSMVAALNELIAKHEVNVIWCTTWENTAPAFGEKIGLLGAEIWPFVETRDEHGVWGKHATLQDIVANTNTEHKIAWIDDDLITEHDAQLWASQTGVLAIAPYVHHGITPATLHQLDKHYSR